MLFSNNNPSSPTPPPNPKRTSRALGAGHRAPNAGGAALRAAALLQADADGVERLAGDDADHPADGAFVFLWCVLGARGRGAVSGCKVAARRAAVRARAL